MIRAPLPSDQSYIAATWARSMLSGMRSRGGADDAQQAEARAWRGHVMRRHGADREQPSNRSIERDLRAMIGANIDAVMDRDDTRGLVSVRDDDPNYIVGWVVFVKGPSVPSFTICTVATTTLRDGRCEVKASRPRFLIASALTDRMLSCARATDRAARSCAVGTRRACTCR